MPGIKRRRRTKYGPRTRKRKSIRPTRLHPYRRPANTTRKKGIGFKRRRRRTAKSSVRLRTRYKHRRLRKLATALVTYGGMTAQVTRVSDYRVEFATTYGRQAFHYINFLDRATLETWRLDPQNDAIYVRDASMILHCSNFSNTVGYYNIYYCKPRVAVPASATFTSISVWVTSLFNHDGVGTTVIGVTPFQSPTFCRFVKVMKVRRIKLESGQTFRHKVSRLRPFKYSAETMVPGDWHTTSQTRFLLIHQVGSVVAQTGNAQATIDNTRLGVVVTTRATTAMVAPNNNEHRAATTVSTQGPAQMFNMDMAAIAEADL